MNTELINALVSNLSTTTFLLGKLLDEINGQDTVTGKVEKVIPISVPVDDFGFAEISPNVIINFVTKKYQIDILKVKRDSEVVEARNVACYLIKKYTSLSLKSIGRLFGKDHTTIMHSIGKVKFKMKGKRYKSHIEMLEVELVEYVEQTNKNIGVSGE